MGTLSHAYYETYVAPELELWDGNVYDALDVLSVLEGMCQTYRFAVETFD